MRRRTVLATLPPLFAGCLGASDGTSDDAVTTVATTAATPSTPSPTERTTETAAETTTKQPYDPIQPDPASMTEDEVREGLADRDCTEFTELPTTFPSGDGQLDVSVSPTVGELPDATVEFTVENQSDETFKTNHYGWILRKWDGSRWRRIAPLAIPAPLSQISPGESHTHRITPVENKPIRSQRAYMAETDVTIGGLGPGVYGFSTRGYFESAPDDEHAAAAVFGFAGDAPPVRPTDDVNRVERDGGTLVVQADAPSDRRGELVVSLVDGEADAQLLTEHVQQLAALLNTLPYAATDGVETIRYLGRADDVSMVDSYLSAVTPDGATQFRLRDYVFELTVEGA